MPEYGKPYEPKKIEEDSFSPGRALSAALETISAESSQLKTSVDEGAHLRLSVSAMFGWVTGGFLLFSGAITLGQTESVMHQIYQVLCFGHGSLLVVAGSVAQHTKGLKRD